MVRRKGLGKGRGKGFKNILPKDPKVHADSARGMKQPQIIRMRRGESEGDFIHRREREDLIEDERKCELGITFEYNTVIKKEFIKPTRMAR